MIQRIQSIYLLLGAVSLIAIMFIDSLGASAAAESMPWFVPAVPLTAGLAAALALAAIFLYGSRPKQVSTVRGGQVLTLLCMVVLYGGLILESSTEFFPPGESGQVLLLLLPIVAYVTLYLARRAIRKDIELVKSMDRLR
jgi:hypothetical protein